MASSVSAGFNMYLALGSEGTERPAICEYMLQEFGMIRIRPGELVAAAKANPNAEYHHVIVSKETSGETLPEEIVCKIMLNFMRESRCKTFVLDNYPVHPFQLYAVTDILVPHAKILQVIYLACPADICVARHLASGHAPQGLDAAMLHKNIEAYLNDVKPVVEFYHDKGLLLQVNSDKPLVDICKDVLVAIEAVKARGDF